MDLFFLIIICSSFHFISFRSIVITYIFFLLFSSLFFFFNYLFSRFHFISVQFILFRPIPSVAAPPATHSRSLLTISPRVLPQLLSRPWRSLSGLARGGRRGGHARAGQEGGAPRPRGGVGRGVGVGGRARVRTGGVEFEKVELELELGPGVVQMGRVREIGYRVCKVMGSRFQSSSSSRFCKD